MGTVIRSRELMRHSPLGRFYRCCLREEPSKNILETDKSFFQEKSLVVAVMLSDVLWDRRRCEKR